MAGARLPSNLRFKLELIAHKHGVKMRSTGEAVAKLLNGPELTDKEKKVIEEVVKFFEAQDLMGE